MHEIKKSDWKLFRELLPQWQENYMDKLDHEYIAILSRSDENPSTNFWELDERMKKDKRRKGVQMRLEKKSVVYDILELIRDGVIDMEDLSDFSDELKEDLQFLIDRNYGIF